MQLVLDGEIRDVSGDDILQTIKEYLHQNADLDRVLKCCLVNGMEVADPFTVLAENVKAELVDKVEVITIGRKRLVYEVIATAVEYLGRLTTFIIETADNINAGDSIPPKTWSSILDGLEWTVSACEGISRQADLLPALSMQLKTQVDQLNSSLASTLASMKDGDMLSVGDGLEYEVAVILGELEKILRLCLDGWEKDEEQPSLI